MSIVTRDATLSASKVVVEKVDEHPRIDVIANAAPAEFCGKGKLQTVVLRDTKTAALTEIAVDGVFVFIGLTPNTAIVRDQVGTDERGFIVTDVGMQTSLPGVFAAGDCREGSTKQAASAAGEGAAAALAIRRYIQPLTSGMPDHGQMMEMAAAG